MASHEVRCPNGHKLQALAEHAGRQVMCPKCQVAFTVPDLSGVGLAGGATLASPPPPPSGTNLGGNSWPSMPAVSASAPSISGSLPSFTVPRLTGLFSRESGLTVTLFGLLCVLGARGCESLGMRGVQRAKAQWQLTQNRFRDKWDASRQSLRTRLNKVASSDAEERRKLQRDLDDIDERERKEREDLERTDWRALLVADRDTPLENAALAYWREAVFVGGTMLLAAGLLLLAGHSQGAERTLTYVLLSIILFSLYVGGTAWFVGLLPVLK